MRPRKLTAARIVTTIEPSRGNLSRMARALGVSRRALYDIVAGSEDLQVRIFEAREDRIDRAEEALDTALDVGERWAVLEVLHSTAGRRRGWTTNDQDERLAELEARYAALLAHFPGAQEDGTDA